MKPDDAAILKKLKEGDSSGFRELFDAYYGPLCAHSLKYCDSYDMAEDIVQELFVSFWNDKLYLKIEAGGAGPYLFKAVRNNTVLQMRRESKFIFEDLDHVINQMIEDENPEGISVEEERARLLEAVENLPEQSREVFKAIVLHNMAYKEVAELLDISVNTVKTHYSRALKKLRGSALLNALLMLK